METLDVSTLVYLPREEVYDFLVEFPRYAKYSEHLDEVRRFGDGDSGTEYDLTFAWWKLSYTARSKVTDLDQPARIDWELVRDLDAHGYWEVVPEPESAPEGEQTATRVHFVVNVSPESASPDAIDLPSFTSIDWVVEKVTPKIRAEAEQVVRRIVHDLEGEDRDITLTVHDTPDSV